MFSQGFFLSHSGARAKPASPESKDAKHAVATDGVHGFRPARGSARPE
jgi:hypothetical protein